MQNRFGMFIHWGIYSTLGIHEQALSRFDLDYAEYEALAESFNPTEYDPREWVRLAKSAGMEYICFTTKHHDGFCLWDTAATDYNIMNTPYGRDVLKRYKKELKKGYYAVIGDPLYKLLLPKNSPSIFIERPHRAQSGRIYPPTEKTLDELVEELKEKL